MKRPICVRCRVEYRCTKNDQLVNDAAIGNFPATYWFGDLFACPRCGSEIVVGRGQKLMEPDLLGRSCLEFDSESKE